MNDESIEGIGITLIVLVSALGLMYILPQMPQYEYQTIHIEPVGKDNCTKLYNDETIYFHKSGSVDINVLKHFGERYKSLGCVFHRPVTISYTYHQTSNM